MTEDASDPVTISESTGVQIGDGNTQIVYTYNRLTWTDGVAAPPIVSVGGDIASPYRGLSSFGERDAGFFFGRDAATEAVLQRMGDRLLGGGPLVVSGVSGAGKSSLLAAGVIPRLRGAGLPGAPEAAGWPCIVFQPGHDPLDELVLRVAALAGVDAGALRAGVRSDVQGFALTVRQAALRGAEPADGGSAPRLVIVVDQFEQTFTQCTDEDERRRFVGTLATLAVDAAAVVVVGVRADFEARCAEYPELADAVQGRYLLTAMTERQLRTAISEPARQAGSSVDPALVDQLVHEVGAGAGVLPLLSHALDEAWRHRAGEHLTLTDYERTGGIEGAVAESAERAYGTLTESQRAIAKALFVRLVVVDRDGVETADRIARAELDADTGIDPSGLSAVLEAFTAERLLVLAAGTVEIGHEVLIRAWPMLRDDWLAESRADRVVRSRLRAVAAEWRADGEDPSYLYTGTLLGAAASSPSPLAPDERDFLAASEHAANRRVRRRRRLTMSLGAAAAVFAVVAVLAVVATQNATRQRDVAVSAEYDSETTAVGDTHPLAKQMFGLGAWALENSDAAHYALEKAASEPGITDIESNAHQVESMTFLRDGSTLVSGDDDGSLRFWDLETATEVGVPIVPKGGGTVSAVVQSPASPDIATGDTDGTIQMWSIATHRPLGSPIAEHVGDIQSIAFSPDGREIVAAMSDGSLRVWAVADHRQVGATMHASSGQWSVAWSPDGATIASGGQDGTVRVWSARSDTIVRVLDPPKATSVRSIAFSPSGSELAAGYVGTYPVLWDTGTFKQLPTTPRPASGSTVDGVLVAFTPDSTDLITAAFGAKPDVRMTNVNTGEPAGVFGGEQMGAGSLAVSPDGHLFATGSYGNGTIRLWNDRTDRQRGNPLVSGRPGEIGLTATAYDPSGQRLAGITSDRHAAIWNLASRRQLMETSSTVGGPIGFSPDGRDIIVTNSDDTAVRVVSASTGRQVGTTMQAGGHILKLAYSPGGTMIAASDFTRLRADDGTVRIWNARTHALIRSAATNSRHGRIDDFAFSPSGTRIATAGQDGVLRVWSTSTGRLLHSSRSDVSLALDAVAWSADGAAIVTGGADGALRTWSGANGAYDNETLDNAESGDVNTLVLSPDGRTVFAGDDDGTVHLWDVDTRREITELPVPTIANSSITAIAMSPTGSSLVTSDLGGTTRIWDVSYVDHPRAFLCAQSRKMFTRSAWKEDHPADDPFMQLCPLPEG